MFTSQGESDFPANACELIPYMLLCGGCRQAYDALGLYHGVARTWLNPASVSFLNYVLLLT